MSKKKYLDLYFFRKIQTFEKLKKEEYSSLLQKQSKISTRKVETFISIGFSNRSSFKCDQNFGNRLFLSCSKVKNYTF